MEERQGEDRRKRKRNGWTARNKCKHVFKSVYYECVCEGADRMGVSFLFIKHLLSLRTTHPIDTKCLFTGFHYWRQKKVTRLRLGCQQTSWEVCKMENLGFICSFHDSRIPLWSALSRCSPVRWWSSVRNDHWCPQLKTTTATVRFSPKIKQI